MTTIIVPAVVPAVVNKYNHSKVYKIFSTLPELDGKFYVGSTTQTLAQRLGKHRGSSREAGKNSTLYTLMRLHGCDSFKIELLEKVNCVDKDELRVAENKWIKTLDTVNNGWNCNYAVFDVERTKQQHKQWYQDNAETIKQYKKQYEHKDNRKQYKKEYEHKDNRKQYKKQYNEANKTTLKQKRDAVKGTFKCETCDTTHYNNSSLLRHYKTKRHINNVATPITTPTPIAI